jgi:hypothetical protein
MLQLRGSGLGEDWSTMTPDEAPTGEDRPAAAVYCGKKYGTTSPYFQPCVDFYAGPHIGEYVPSSASPGTKITKLPPIFGGGSPSTFLNPSSTATNKIGSGGVLPLPSIPVVFPAGVPWYKTPLGIGALVLGGIFAYRRLKR